jgi:endonuclease/exonuclease/phosphatase family metal-dependent hydrolase
MLSKTRKSNHKTHLKSSIQRSKTSIKSTIKSQQKAINIIAYNLSWESMTGNKPKWALCSNNTDPNHPRHNSVCVGNVASVLEDNASDFILLQEAESHIDIIKESPRLAKMEYEMHESGKDKMITFWNKKYIMKKIVRDEFESGRPWMAILYTNGWCIVNVHFGHYFRFQEINKLNQLIRKIKKELYQSGGYKRLIIGGDFNYDIKKLGKDGKMLLDDVIFHYHPTNLLTCCINRQGQYDHVIDTLAPLLDIKIPQVEYMASDHKPVLATLQR